METNLNVEEFTIDVVQDPEDISDVIYSLMVNPNLAPVNYFNDFSEEPIDPKLISSNDTEDSGIIQLDGYPVPMVMTTHAMHHNLADDPESATEILISRAARKMATYGAKPLVVNAFLYHIDIADPNGQFIASGSKKGLENAATVFGLKIGDRKIRFDIFEQDGASLPTLIITMFGIMESKDKVLTPGFKVKGNNIFMIGKSYDDIAASEYLEFYHGISDSGFQIYDLDDEKRIQDTVLELNRLDLIQSANPVGRGGLFFTLLRSAMPRELGFDITTDAEIRRDAFLFGEAMGRILVGVHPSKENDFVDYMTETKIPFFALGHVTKGEVRIDDISFGYIDKIAINPES
ncbi:MAG: AIR synthase-related protein [Bacteroidota bacterium]|nr:AIR synthase-related protein [Bacteroidota bacterium]MDP4204764.1 AIR synthase-related protein [Bacteroidota bacterium]